MLSLKNLSFLNSKIQIGGKSRNDCKSQIIAETIEEFNDKKLKTKNGSIVKNKKQAIAIALNMASHCKYNKEDMQTLIEKVNKDLNNKNKELNLSNVIETKDAISLLLNNKKNKQAYVFKKILWEKIINENKKGNVLDKNIWNEIHHIQNL